MSKLCQGLNHLDRVTARLIYEQRLAQSRPETRDDQNSLSRAESVDSEWLDNLDPECLESLMGGPDDSYLESGY
ncbi:hypothetical protein [Halopseudomonas sp.]|uniref:hypothetical protein n=1 Tax=Halopseudomonas sp. TaxID=2901191 RepID=UPI003001E99A